MTDWTDLNSFGQAYGYKGTMTGVSFGSATPGTGLDASQAGETGGLAGALQDGSVSPDEDNLFIFENGDDFIVGVAVPEKYIGWKSSIDLPSLNTGPSFYDYSVFIVQAAGQTAVNAAQGVQDTARVGRKDMLINEQYMLHLR